MMDARGPSQGVRHEASSLIGNATYHNPQTTTFRAAMGLIASKAQDIITFALTSLGLFDWLIFREHSERLRVISTASRGEVACALHTSREDDDSEEVLAIRMKEFEKSYGRDRNLEPERAALLNREYLLNFHQSTRWAEIQVSPNVYRKRTTVFGLQKHFSTTTLEQLTRGKALASMAFTNSC
jgi:hypothetical protein